MHPSTDGSADDGEIRLAPRSRADAAPDVVRIAIATELRLLRDGLADALRRRGRLQVVATASDGDEALRQVRMHAPTLLLLDMALAGSLTLVRALAAHGTPQVIAFAVTDRESDLVACIEAGVAGYIARDGTLDDVIATIDRVRRGETLCSPRLTASLFRRLAALERERRGAVHLPAPVAVAPLADAPTDVASELSPREHQILLLIEQGLANKEIAHQLGIEVPTVKNHVHRILEKLGVARRGQAAARVRATGPHAWPDTAAAVARAVDR